MKTNSQVSPTWLFLVILLEAVACATTPSVAAPSTQRWSNIATEVDSPCFEKARCQTYRLRFQGGQKVRVRLDASDSATVVVSPSFGEFEALRETAVAGRSAAIEVTVPGRPTSPEVLTVAVMTSAGQAQVEYALEVAPAPSDVESAPLSKEKRLAKLRAQQESRAESEARAATEKLAREREEQRAKKLASERAAQCKQGNVIIQRLRRSSGNEEFLFCDETTVVRTPRDEWSLSQALRGELFERFTSREAAALEVASHNARVLNSNEARRHEGAVRAAYEAKVQAFLAQHRWPKDRYIAQAKRCSLTTSEAP